jgi:signal transduction histidine kinase
MCEARALFSVRLPEFTRTTTFRWTLIISSAFALAIFASFAFVYVQAIYDILSRIDAAVTNEAATISHETPEQRLESIAERMRQDPRRVKPIGLFSADGKRIAGNIESLPANLPIDAAPQDLPIVRIDAFGREPQMARATARRLADGDVLLVAWSNDYNNEITEIIKRGLALAIIPALSLGFAAAIFLSIRTQKRVDDVNRRVQRIVAGQLRERLATKGVNDPFDRLAVIVNGMLDEIEALVQSMAGAGDDIAHDLRTPLTRARVMLERARQNATTLEELRKSVDQAIVGLDQSLAIITALLRITEIEHSRRRAAFSDIALGDLVREVGDLYEPIAEDKRVGFKVGADAEAIVRGDRDLLFEAVANLVDNAVKFTPEGGRVELNLAREGGEGIVRVHDSGPGIAAAERDLVGRRFYRSDKSRSDPGLGLGLSLVAAIVKLHGFRFAISVGPGCVAEIAGPLTSR